MAEFEERLRQLVTEACNHQPGSAQRQKNLTQIIRLISNKLWKENQPYYQDALQQTWIYFCQNICEGNTGEPYNPERSSIITWLNFYLKRRLQDYYRDDQKRQARTVSSYSVGLGSSEADEIDPIDKLEADPDVPLLLEQVKNWVESDPEGELRSTHLTNRPDITCQLLILRRLPPEASWKSLAAEYNLSISTLSSFYQRQCLPRLRKFGESEGYL